jgi:AcrR family transcriptional regulator
MARRSEHTKEELKSIAIAAGIELIETNGFRAFSARGAAAKMGYTVGTLYHLFGTLDEFVLNINVTTLDIWFKAMESSLKRSKEKPVHALAKAYFQFAKKNYMRWLALFEHRMADGKEVPEWYVPKMTRFFTLIETALLPYVKNNPDKAKDAGKVLWSGIHGICVLALSGKLDIEKKESPEPLIMLLVDNILAGLEK